MGEVAPLADPKILGRYALFDAIASGGMGSVHIGKVLGAAGFTRAVAIKRAHPHLASEPDFVALFIDEARLASRIRHRNVASVLDVVAEGNEVFIVMEYVHGESMARLLRIAQRMGRSIPIAIASAVVCDALHGLHAAHEAKTERGEPMELVHRDVSPQNLLVGVDGATRVLDFGIAKAKGQLHLTREGEIRGKIAYMAPEQLLRGKVTRCTDIYAASVVLWELLTGGNLVVGDSEAAMVQRVLEGVTPSPTTLRRDIPADLDRLVMKGLNPDSTKRYQTALEMAKELESTVVPARPSEVGEWVESLSGPALAQRADWVAAVECRTIPPPKESLGESKVEISAKPLSSSAQATGNLVATTPPTSQLKMAPESSEAITRKKPEPASVASPTHEVSSSWPESPQSSAVTKDSRGVPSGESQRGTFVLKAFGLLALVGVAILTTVFIVRPPSNLASPNTPQSSATSGIDPKASASLPLIASAVPSTSASFPSPLPSVPAVASVLPTASVPRPMMTGAAPRPTATPKPNCRTEKRLDADGIWVYVQVCN